MPDAIRSNCDVSTTPTALATFERISASEMSGDIVGTEADRGGVVVLGGAVAVRV